MEQRNKILLIVMLLALAAFSPQGIYLANSAASLRLAYATAQAAGIQEFTREFEVSVETGISLNGSLDQTLVKDKERPGRWIFNSRIRVWGISAAETSIFSVPESGEIIPIYYKLIVPFSDDIDDEFSGRQRGFDRLNVLLQFERDFASNPNKTIWKYKVLSYDKPYSVQLKTRQTITLANGSIARCKVFEAVHGSRNQLKTRFWMDVDRNRLVQIAHSEEDYTYVAVLKE